MNQRQNRAFTLIELLVVIAIIAILAAILFPVFAQAKLAAKATAGLSNTKQQSLGLLMYSNDYDDMWVVDMSFNVPNAPFYFGAPFNGFATWSALEIPYIKTSQIFIDPIAGGTNGATNGVANWEAYNPEYGLNWTLLNGGYRNDPSTVGYGTTSTTAISRPADMVMLGETTLHTDPNWGGFYGIGSNGGETIGTVLGNIEGPYCNYSIGCSDLSSYWGTDNGWAGQSPDSPETAPGYIEGGDTSGVVLRDHGLNTIAFTDGHAKAMSIGALAVGTNWNSTSTKSQVQLTNADTYRWWQY